jgi:hypothetical protein
MDRMMLRGILTPCGWLWNESIPQGKPDAEASGYQPGFVAGLESAKPEGLAYLEAHNGPLML